MTALEEIQKAIAESRAFYPETPTNHDPFREALAEAIAVFVALSGYFPDDGPTMNRIAAKLRGE